MARVCDDFTEGENDHIMKQMFNDTNQYIVDIKNIWDTHTVQELGAFFTSIVICGIDTFLQPVVDLMKTKTISRREYNLHRDEIEFMVKFLREVGRSGLTNEEDYRYLVKK